jgi:hypothetical protein
MTFQENKMSDPIVAAPAAVDTSVNSGAIDGVEAEIVEDDGADLGMADEGAAIDAAAKAGDISKSQAQAMKKSLKLKIDGQEEDFEVDFNNDEELKKHFQKSKAFDKRAKEFSSYKSQMDQVIQMLQEDPEGLLEKMGIDVDTLSEKRLEKRINEMKKSPQELEAEKMRKELEDYKKREKEATTKAQQAEQEKLRNQAASQIESDITDALEGGSSFLPKKSPWVLRNVAQYMYMAATNGYPEVTAKDVLPLVEKQFQSELQELFSVSSEDVMEKVIGKANLDKYRKSVIQKNRKSAAAPVTAKQAVRDTGNSKRNQPEPAEPEKFRMKDVFGIRPK